MGRKRAENGSSRPFGVKLWAVGNEMYGDWQIGHMPLEKYVEKHRRGRGRDAGGRPEDPAGRGRRRGRVEPDDARELPPAHMSYMSEHLYWQDKPDVPAHVAQAVEGIRKVAEAHRAYDREIPALKGKDIRVALDEWNYWYGPNEYGELGTRYFLQDGLGIAAGLHELFRNSDIFFMANYAQTVNVIGAIKTTATAAEMEATGLALALYRRHFGTLPLKVEGAPSPLDVAAAFTADRSALTVAVVNPTGEARRLKLDLAGAAVAGRARRLRPDRRRPLVPQRPGSSPRRDGGRDVPFPGRGRARRSRPSASSSTSSRCAEDCPVAYAELSFSRTARAEFRSRTASWGAPLTAPCKLLSL